MSVPPYFGQPFCLKLEVDIWLARCMNLTSKNALCFLLFLCFTFSFNAEETNAAADNQPEVDFYSDWSDDSICELTGYDEVLPGVFEEVESRGLACFDGKVAPNKYFASLQEKLQSLSCVDGPRIGSFEPTNPEMSCESRGFTSECFFFASPSMDWLEAIGYDWLYFPDDPETGNTIWPPLLPYFLNLKIPVGAQKWPSYGQWPASESYYVRPLSGCSFTRILDRFSSTCAKLDGELLDPAICHFVSEKQEDKFEVRIALTGKITLKFFDDRFPAGKFVGWQKVDFEPEKIEIMNVFHREVLQRLEMSPGSWGITDYFDAETCNQMAQDAVAGTRYEAPNCIIGVLAYETFADWESVGQYGLFDLPELGPTFLPFETWSRF